MGKRKVAIISTIGLSITALLTATAVSFAAYTKTTDVNVDIGAGSWRKDTIFLNGTPTDHSGQWDSDNAAIFIYAYKLENAVHTNETWIENTGKNPAGYFFFHLPLVAYTHIVFVRVNPDYINDPGFGDKYWNQSYDLELSSRGTTSTHPNNLYSLYTYGRGTGSGNEATGAWGYYSPS